MNNRLKIVIPYYPAPDNFADNVRFTLDKMGHDVICMPPRSNESLSNRYWTYYRLFRSMTALNYRPPEEKWLLQVAKDTSIDIVLALTQCIGAETLFQLKRSGVGQLIAWWGDAPSNMKRMGLLCEEWDIIFFKDSDAVAKFRRLGFNAHLLHEAMNPAWHRPVASQRNENIVVAGNFYGYRQYLVTRLLQDGLKMELYGNPLPRWTDSHIRKVHSGRYIAKEEKSRIFGEALACLNSTSWQEGNSMNCRAFEIAGAGGLHIMEYRPNIEECFDPGKELLVFHTYEELLHQIEWARRSPKEMSEIRTAGAKRALAQHTYEHRLKVILGER